MLQVGCYKYLEGLGTYGDTVCEASIADSSEISDTPVTVMHKGLVWQFHRRVLTGIRI